MGRVSETLSWIVVALSVLIAVVALVQVALDRPVGGALLGLLFALEGALLVQLFYGIVQLGDPDASDVDKVTFIGYLGAALLVRPRPAVERRRALSRAGTAIYAVIGLVVPFLVLRLFQIWTA